MGCFWNESWSYAETVVPFPLPSLGLTKVAMTAQVILMDHVDWQDNAQARVLAAALAKHVAPGGRVIWRSAALCPPYARIISEAGFDVQCLSRADEGYMDRVNMVSKYAHHVLLRLLSAKSWDPTRAPTPRGIFEALQCSARTSKP